MDVPMCSQALYGHFSVLSLWTWPCSQPLRIPSVHLPGFNTPHDVQETAFNGWWEEGHSNVPPFNPWLGPQQGRTSKQSEQRCPSWEVSRISVIGPRALSHCQMHTDKTKHLLQRSNDVCFLLYSCQRRKRSLSQQRCKSFFWNRGSNKSCQAGETL